MNLFTVILHFSALILKGTLNNSNETLIWHAFYVESKCSSGIVQEVLQFGKNLNNLPVFRWLHLPL